MPSPGITERLANMSTWTVLIVIAVLLVIRWWMLQQKTPIRKQVGEIAESLAVAMGLVFLIIRPFIIQAFFIPSGSMVPTLLEDDHIMVNKFIYRFTEVKRGDVIVFSAPKAADNQSLPGEKQERDFIKRVIAVPGDEVRISPGYVLVGDDERYQDRATLRDLLSDKSAYAEQGRPGTDMGTVKLLSEKAVLVDGKQVMTKAEIAAVAEDPNAPVTIVPGRVYVNGKAIREPYVNEDASDEYDPRRDTWRRSGTYPNDTTPKKWVTQDKEGHNVVKIPKGYLLVMGDNRNVSYDARFWGLLERKRVLGKAMFVFWPLGRMRWIR